MIRINLSSLAPAKTKRGGKRAATASVSVPGENQRLSEVKAQHEASKRKADMYQRRVKVVDDLKEAQKGPVNMLNLVADTVNKTDAVWLETMTSDGKSLTFVGTALSADAVA